MRVYVFAYVVCVLHVGLLELPGFTVHSGQQEASRLPHVVTVHRETPAVLSVSHRHSDPLHQGRQYQEWPVGGDTERPRLL